MIINCAASVFKDEQLDLTVRVNVSGPLQLLKIAEECPRLDSFLQVSTCFVNCEKTGFIEEQMYNNIRINWRSKLDEILNLNKRDLQKNSAELMLPFPNAYSFSKRMCEHLLVEANTKNVPLTILRSGTIGAAAEDPCSGWTDTLGLLSGAAILVGLGILKDMTGNENLITEIVPVDFVGKQILVQAAYAAHLYRNTQGKDNYFISHCATSSSNPVTWKHFLESITSYQNDFAYDQRVGRAQVVFHKSETSYKFAHRLKSVIPAYTMFYVSKVIGTKKFKD